VAPIPDAPQQQANLGISAPSPNPASRQGRWKRWLYTLSLRHRLQLLVVASVVPLVCLGVVREYFNYTELRDRIYADLLSIARRTSVSVARDLEQQTSALETLALSAALIQNDLNSFDQLAKNFLGRFPPGSVLGIVTPDRQVQRIYGLPGGLSTRLSAAGLSPPSLPRRSASAKELQVFDTGRPVITDLHRGTLTGIWRISVDVPVIRDDKVIYDLFVQVSASILGDLIHSQYLPSGTVLEVVDTAGAVVAHVPYADRFIGSHIVPGLWSLMQTHPQGIKLAPTLDGAPTIAAYTHVPASNWAIVVSAPEDVVFAPMRRAMLELAVAGMTALTAGLLLAMLAARGITRPIAQLRWLAANEDKIEPAAAVTGLPDTDNVARMLKTAAMERQAAAKALAESEMRFRALFDRSASGMILLDPKTIRIVDVNPAAASTFGYSIPELIGRGIAEFALRSSPEEIREYVNSVAAGGTMRYETRVKGQDGPRDLLVAAAPVQVAGRTLVLLDQIDVTDLRRAQAGLRVNEERLELAREGANLGIWDWDVVNKTLTWSDHQWYLHGLTPDPTGPSHEVWQNAMHPADRRRTLRELTAALRHSNRPYMTEYSVVKPDGSIRRLMGRGQTIRNAQGRVVRMVGINMDVTARYHAEMARDRLITVLETERSRLVEIFDALPIGVGIVDTTGRVVLGNVAMKRLNGPFIPSKNKLPVGEWIGLDANGNQVPPEDYPVQRALQLGEATLPGREFLFRDANGAETWYRVASIPLRRQGGQIQEVLGIFQDIDAEKRLLDIQQQINISLEQRVQQEVAARQAAQQRAAHAERMQALGQIAGGIAHDFNNVLQAVSGGATLIENRPLDVERVLHIARMIQDAANRGASITSRLLTFARRGVLRAENVDVAALLTDMAEVLDHTLGGSVVCVVDAAGDLPPLFADRGQLETVLVNLAANARDAMETGGTLTLVARADSVAVAQTHPAGLAPGHYVRIEVADTGIGMNRGVLARVTEPFFTTKAPGKGTGLGLAMAKGFMEQSGGGLSIDSAVGHGTRINLWLPRGTKIPRPVPERIASDGANVTRISVLLVDDDPIVRDVMVQSLQDAGYAVLSADSGTAAMSLLGEEGRIDILVSDLTMPEMNGLALIRSAQALRPNLPAVLLTGYAGDGAALAVGAVVGGTFSLLRKPVSGAQLVDRINALLASRQQLGS
jgi:PAS domain S-box-containing protein